MANRTAGELFDAVIACRTEAEMADVVLSETAFQARNKVIDARTVAISNIIHVISWSEDRDERVRVTQLLNRTKGTV